jgi:hypothetical protein
VKLEIVNRKDGTRLSHTAPGQIMGTTLFGSEQEASDWMKRNGLSSEDYRIATVEVQAK